MSKFLSKIDQTVHQSLKESLFQKIIAFLTLSSFIVTVISGVMKMQGLIKDPTLPIVAFILTLVLALVAYLYTRYVSKCPLCNGGPIKIFNKKVTHEEAKEILKMEHMPLSVRGAKATIATKKHRWYIDGYKCSGCGMFSVTGLNSRK